MRSIWWWGGHAFVGTPVTGIYVVLHALAELVEQECTFEAHLEDSALESCFAGDGFVVGRLNFGQAAFEFDAFSVVCLFHAGRERRALWCIER